MLPGNSVIREFESLIAKHCKKDYVIATCNASTAILGAFQALELKDKEVITSPWTWPGALAGLRMLNCKLKFCEIEPDFFTIDSAKLDGLITQDTKAIFSTDFLGYPCKLDKILEICKKHNLLLIHDAASSFGSYYKQYQSGYYADVTIYSFGRQKLFSIGEGGCIATSNEDIYKKIVYTIAHPERQQIEYSDTNYFSLNMTINPFAVEYGIKTFPEQLEFILNRRGRIQEYLSCINSPQDKNDFFPNYYKILLEKKELSILEKNIPSNISINDFIDKQDLLTSYFNCERLLKSNFFVPVSPEALTDIQIR